MANRLYVLVDEAPDFEAFHVYLSITTFRFVPIDNTLDKDELNQLNEEMMVRLQNGGRAFITNAVIDGNFVLRACIVNHRTQEKDIDALPDLLREIAAEIMSGQ